MTKQEIFKVLDALPLTICDLKEYLDRMCDKTPLPLVYFKKGKFEIRYEVQMDELNHLFGILLPESKKVLRLQAVNAADFSLKNEKELTREEVLTWVKKKFSPDIGQTRIASNMDIRALWPYRKEVDLTLDILYGKGVQKLPSLGECPGWLDAGQPRINNLRGCFSFEKYLKECGDILLFTEGLP